MPTSTMPVPQSVMNRISGRLTEVYPKLESGAAFTTLGRVMLPLVDRDLQTALTQWVVFEGMEALQLATRVLGPEDILLEVQDQVPSDDQVTTRPLDAWQVKAHLNRQQLAREPNEWEDYREPLWDAIRSKVRLLVRDYFEQADAHSD